MRSIKNFIFLLFIAANAWSQIPQGVFRMSDGGHLSVGEIEGKSFIVYDSGELRGLRPSVDPGMYEIGNAVGTFDRVEGSLQLTDNGRSIKWTRIGSAMTGHKMNFTEQEIQFFNSKIKLSGTLILPEGNGKFPCIVFTHGSGIETRESSRGLAYLFASHGIAALIYDKRGTGKSAGKDWQDSFDNYAGDAIAAADLIKDNSAIEKKSIGIYGHSQGGWVAPLAVSKSNLFSFAIFSAANAVSPVEQHLAAGDEEYRLLGFDETAIKEIHEFRELKYQIGITGNGKNEYTNKLLPAAENKTWFKTTGGNLPESVFWKANGFYDPTNTLKSLTCPILLIYGSHDISTNTERNLRLMKTLLQPATTEYKVFENTNHMMMRVSKRDYATKQLPFVTQFADGYLESLISWTKRTTGSR